MYVVVCFVTGAGFIMNLGRPVGILSLRAFIYDRYVSGDLRSNFQGKILQTWFEK